MIQFMKETAGLAIISDERHRK